MLSYPRPPSNVMTARDKEEQRKQAVLVYRLDQNAGWDQILDAQLKAIAEEKKNPLAVSEKDSRMLYRIEAAIGLGLPEYARWNEVAARLNRDNREAAEQAAINEFETIVTRSTEGRQADIMELERMTRLPPATTPETGFLRNLKRNLRALDTGLEI